MKKCISAIFLSSIFAGVGCENKSADKVIREKQEVVQKEQVRQVGLPNITRFTEAKRLRYLYELRDRADLTCWVYSRDMHGKMHLIGVGMGYPIPAGTQFSNPNKVSDDSYHAVVAQSEPNGVFPPSTAEATWVILMTRNGPKPFYGETRLEAYPERLPSADESNTVWPSGKPIPPDVTAPPPATDDDIKAFETK